MPAQLAFEHKWSVATVRQERHFPFLTSTGLFGVKSGQPKACILYAQLKHQGQATTTPRMLISCMRSMWSSLFCHRLATPGISDSNPFFIFQCPCCLGLLKLSASFEIEMYRHPSYQCCKYGIPISRIRTNSNGPADAQDCACTTCHNNEQLILSVQISMPSPNNRLFYQGIPRQRMNMMVPLIGHDLQIPRCHGLADADHP